MNYPQLYFGDNLDIMRKYIKDETVDLCYIDPPFNSKRNYNQIYNNIGTEDKAQVLAFVDKWDWDVESVKSLNEIMLNKHKLPHQAIDLIEGLTKILGKGSMLAYIVSMTLRIAEIHRVLKPTGSFYLHCDTTASHYLKLLLDAVFCSQGGDFKNEIIWSYRSTLKVLKSHFGKDHDVIFFYTKGKNSYFNPDRKDFPPSESTIKRWGKYADENGFVSNKHFAGSKTTIIDTTDENKGFNINHGIPRDVWDISILAGSNKEKLGYPTQKPEKLLERIIKASSNEGDVVLDCYCGCGTTIAVAQRLNRKWIGIDITYQSIYVIKKRLIDTYGESIIQNKNIKGVPLDMKSAHALAKESDKLRKEFEMWAVLTYSNDNAIPNDKKGADGGIDGRLRILDDKYNPSLVLFSVKSGKVGERDIRDFHSVIQIEKAVCGIFLTLQEPTAPMIKYAVNAGTYYCDIYQKEIEVIKIVKIGDMLNGARFEMPTVRVTKQSKKIVEEQGKQLRFDE
ncbi:MAG: restriction endonuclease [Oscillospiraceae bacterium]|nr:restriction endonuclease [Oscillospiraceae bacterium]